MTVCEEIKLKAQRLAAQRGISEAAAYTEVLRRYPALYHQAMEERADSGPAGTSESHNHAREAVRRGSIRA